MKVGSYDMLKVADYQDAPEWARRMFDAINPHLDVLTTASQNRLSFQDNSNAEIVSVTLTHNVEIPIRLQRLVGKPRHAIVLASSDFDSYAKLAWKVEEDNLVRVRVAYDRIDDESPEGREAAVEIAFFGV